MVQIAARCEFPVCDNSTKWGAIGHRGRIRTAWARIQYGQGRKRASTIPKISLSIFIPYVRQRTEQSDATANNSISSPASGFPSSFIVWRIPAPGYAYFRGLFLTSPEYAFSSLKQH
jgi:hypothetical protein